jgi:hypothetical protein
MNGKMATRMAVASLVALIVAAFAASAAAGAAPIVLRFTVAETNPDEFLTQACGFPVETRVQGVVVFRIFDNDATGIVGVTTSDIGATAIAGDNTYRLPRSAGVDLLLTLPSGDLIDISAGQQFELAGVTISDISTGELLVVPHHSTSVDTAQVCAALAA